MSAEIIQFIPRPNHREPNDFATTAVRPALRPKDLATDHVDTAPCEFVWPDEAESVSSET